MQLLIFIINTKKNLLLQTSFSFFLCVVCNINFISFYNIFTFNCSTSLEQRTTTITAAQEFFIVQQSNKNNTKQKLFFNNNNTNNVSPYLKVMLFATIDWLTVCLWERKKKLWRVRKKNAFQCWFICDMKNNLWNWWNKWNNNH